MVVLLLSTGGPMEMDNPLSLLQRLLTKNNGTLENIQKPYLTELCVLILCGLRDAAADQYATKKIMVELAT